MNEDEKSTEVLGLMTGGIAHDLNNFLSPILLGVQTLQRNDIDDKTKRILTMIESSARRAAELVRHLLDYSRGLSTGDFVSPCGYVKLIVEEFFQEHSQRKFKIVVAEDVGEFNLRISESNLKRVARSILQNAVESPSQTNSIGVSVTRVVVDAEYKRTHRFARAGSYICLDVQDFGSGISKENLKHVCDPFFTTDQSGAHSGIGLFLVSTLIKQHEGFMEIESEEGMGTLVKVFIPIAS